MTGNADVCSKNDLACESSLPADMNCVEPVAAVKSRSVEPGSIRILAALAQGEVCSVAEIAKRLDLHAKTIAYHSLILEQAGALRRTPWGRETLLHRHVRSPSEAIVLRLLQDPIRHRMLDFLGQRPVQQTELAHAAGSKPFAAYRLLRELVSRDLVDVTAGPRRIYKAKRSLIDILHAAASKTQ